MRRGQLRRRDGVGLRYRRLWCPLSRMCPWGAFALKCGAPKVGTPTQFDTE